MTAPDIITFINARLDEEAAREAAATPGPWRYDPTKVNAITREESVFSGPFGKMAVTVASTGPCDDPQSMIDAEFIAHTRNLAPAVLDMMEAVVEALYWVAGCHSIGDLAQCDAKTETGWDIACHIAAIWAGHEDYQQEWRVG